MKHHKRRIALLLLQKQGNQTRIQLLCVCGHNNVGTPIGLLNIYS